MARIQVLPLPTETVGVYEKTPFVLVVDQCDETFRMVELDGLKELTGATAVICVEGERLDVVGGLELSDDQRQAIVRRIEGMA